MLICALKGTVLLGFVHFKLYMASDYPDLLVCALCELEFYLLYLCFFMLINSGIRETFTKA